MADYQIVCVARQAPHRHIISVGTEGTAASPASTYTVAEVRRMIDTGDSFHTISPTTSAKATVQKDTCQEPDCDVKTIRSGADAVTDNNLDNLVVCP